jgi:hypothetical protein
MGYHLEWADLPSRAIAAVMHSYAERLQGLVCVFAQFAATSIALEV